jgi:putative sigma-54 modulation protein
MSAAIAAAARKRARQARRYRERRRDHHGRAPLDEVPELIEQQMQGVTEEPQTPRLVKSKSFEMKPMAPEDAALHMDMLHHDFYVFRNEADGRVNVVYRRRDGDYGLIAPED